jgi:uncharacterized membrane protein
LVRIVCGRPAGYASGVRKPLPARCLLGVAALSLVVLAAASERSSAQQNAKAQTPIQQPAAIKKPVVGPAPPPSTHYPILLLAQGELEPISPGAVQSTEPPWSVRIGQRGPERLDRPGYPPIPLDPTDVIREGTTDSWIYHAKDSQTGAAVAVHIARAPCSDPASTTKFGFTAAVDHAQLGALMGCARVAADLFPKINNNPTDDDDDDAKDKTPPPTVTHFKAPVAVAYIAGGKMVVKRGATAHVVPGKAGYSLCLSHDGKKLLFTRDEEPSPLRTVNEYDFATGNVKELVRANAFEAFWSPDDAHIAYLRNTDGKWQVWTMPAGAPEQAAVFYPGEATSLYGWADAHTILAGDLQTLSWIGDDGTVKQTVTSTDLYGTGQYNLTSGNTVRIHPLNPDLLLVSADLVPQRGSGVSKGAAAAQPTQAFFVYEVHSKRRAVLSPPDLTSNFAEWSRDGLQIFFTGRAPANGAMAVYKMFWDGTSQTKVLDGYDYVIGQ